jgi:urease accessory protein
MKPLSQKAVRTAATDTRKDMVIRTVTITAMHMTTARMAMANKAIAMITQITHMAMCMAPTANMTIDAVNAAPPSMPALLQLIWLASPALPIGGFSYSEGLEAAIDHGLVHDEHSAAEWLVDQLHLTQSRGDMAVLGQMVTAWQTRDDKRLESLSQWVHATRESAELRLQSEQMGRSMLEWLRNQDAIDDSTIALCNRWVPTYPLMFALALSRTGASLEQCLQTYAFGWAENMVQAAIKSVPLGQNSGQRMLTKLAQHIAPAVSHALQVTDDTRQAFSPMLAILSAQHETQYSRLFRS